MRKTALLFFAAACALALNAKDYRTLPKDKINKIKVAAPGVPDKIGEAEVCLWKDDAVGAVSFTVDDNCAPDQKWWAETSKKYGAKITWFLIVERVDGPMKGFNGTWAGYKKLLDAGHDVQSHSYTHFHDDNMSIADEYRLSKEGIEKHLPGHKVFAVAYPGGPKSSKNSDEEAAKLYCSARGTAGGTNPVGQTNYMRTNKSGISLKEDDQRFGSVYIAKEASDKRYKKNYRAWYIHLAHLLKPGAGYDTEAENAMKFYQEKGVWMPTYTDAAKYAQERDSATLKKVKGAGNEYVFKLTDLMDDSIYDYPLTLKFRTPDDWQKVKVTQNGKSAEYDVKTWEGGKKYVMFGAVPDRGDIQIVKVK